MKIVNEHMIEKELKGADKAEYRRLSGRTYDEFKKDIKKAHADEREIIERYAKYCKSETGKDIDIVDNGVDNTGEFLNVKYVRDDVDFIINGTPLEIKIIENDLFTFRLKLNLLKSYIKQGASVLIVMGWKTDSPKFTILNEEKIQHAIKYGEKIVSGDWEGKPTVKLYRNSFKWSNLPI